VPNPVARFLKVVKNTVTSRGRALQFYTVRDGDLYQGAVG